MPCNRRYRKASTLWLLGEWEGLSGPKLKQKLLETMGSSAEGQERFWEKVQKKTHDQCWEWQGTFHDSGYGLFCVSPKASFQVNLRAHRIAYYLMYGFLPSDAVICHKCDNRKCVNPNHLFLGNRAINAQDMVSKGRQALGESVFTAKLNPKKVQEIRFWHEIGGVSVQALADQYGVGYVAIWNVVNRVFWRHVL